MTQTNQAKPTLDQRRARHAWAVVQETVCRFVTTENGKRVVKEGGKKFGTHAKKLPFRIMASGLGQSLAFLYAKDYAPLLLQGIADWVLSKPQTFNVNNMPEQNALLEKIVNQWGADGLRQATDETLAYLLWLNRFADAEGLTEGGGD